MKKISLVIIFGAINSYVFSRHEHHQTHISQVKCLSAEQWKN